MYALKHPTAIVARGIENIIIVEKNSTHFPVRLACAALSRLISITVFPVILLLETLFYRIPRMLCAIDDQKKFNSRADTVGKYLLAFVLFPFGIRAGDGVSIFFLRRFPSPSVLPFGREEKHGLRMDRVLHPQKTYELENIVKEAIRDKKQVSVVGAGMSQGTQTVPKDPHQVVVTMENFRQIEVFEERNLVKVGAGATWEKIQMELNKRKKSVIVKQASDIFSVGGSIGINCHGWAHEAGPLSNTVVSLDIIDANGEFRTLTPEDELFGCIFGTLGYFGIVVNATLKIVDNVRLEESTTEIDSAEFAAHYARDIQNHNYPLFGGRLSLDGGKKDPLGKVCMVQYECKGNTPLVTPKFIFEPRRGTVVERIGLNLLAHLYDVSAKILTRWFWSKERKAMLRGNKFLTRNAALHPPINSFTMLHHSDLHAQWLQEYFVTKDHLAEFLSYLGSILKKNKVRLVNATIRPVLRDTVSILPYAEQDRFAVVISFAQWKTRKAVRKTKAWVQEVNRHLIARHDKYYQAYFPFASRDEFRLCYGEDCVDNLQRLKEKHDPHHVFGNRYTAKYFDRESQ